MKNNCIMLLQMVLVRKVRLKEMKGTIAIPKKYLLPKPKVVLYPSECVGTTRLAR